MSHRLSQCRRAALRTLTLLFAAATASAATLATSGVVYDGINPAENVTVHLISQGGQDQVVVTDESGKFSIRTPEVDYPGQCLLWAESGDGRLSQIIHARNDSVHTLRLGAPAVVEGKVTDQSDRPVAGASVTAMPALMNGYRKTVETNAIGDYRIELPPRAPIWGAEIRDGYWIHVAASGLYHDVSDMGRDDDVIPIAGQSIRHDVKLYPVGVISGMVLDVNGNPASECTIWIRSHTSADQETKTTFSTTAEGKFSVNTRFTNSPIDLVVTHARWGRMQQRVRSPEPGGELTDVVVNMPGSAKLRGRVTNAQGEPIEGASIGYQDWSARTGADGEFDLGAMPLPNRELPMRISVHAPRKGPREHEMFRLIVPSTDELKMKPDLAEKFMRRVDPTTLFYRHKLVEQPAKPDDEFDMTIQLQPVQTITFKGTVRDEQGNTIPLAQVMVFAGKPQSDRWIDELYPLRTRSFSSVARNDQTVLPMTAGLTDEKGDYQLTMPRDPRPLSNVTAVTSNPHYVRIDPDPVDFSLGVGTEPERVRLVTDIALPLEESMKVVDLVLPPSKPTNQP